MRMKLSGRLMGALLALGLSASFSGMSQAAITDFQAAEGLESSLRNHYTFDGANDAARLLDSGFAGKTLGNNPNPAVYVAGFDGTSTAANTDPVSGSGGYRTFGNPFSESTTVEFIFNANDTTTGGSFIASSFVGGNRLYFGKVDGGALNLTSGPNSNNAEIIAAVDYNIGDWYYAAVSIEESGANWEANAWYANLTAGDTMLTHSVLGNTIAVPSATLPGSGSMGVGRGMFPGASGFRGSLDELTVYDAALTGSVLQGHLDSILVTSVPEPSSFALLGMAGLLFTRHLTRRRKSSVQG